MTGDLEMVPAYRRESFAPSVPPLEAPSGLPDKVAALYLEAVQARQRNMPSAAAMTYRKVLEVGLKLVAPDLADASLQKRIKTLADRHDITPSIAEWAHQIRLDGNAAAHESDDLTTAELGQLHEFTHLVLMYIFTLPSMVASARGAAQ